MKNKFVLLSGSASRSCPVDKLNYAIEFIKAFTREVLNGGGGVVLLGSDESQAVSDQGNPLIFDWIVLREIRAYMEGTTNSPRQYVRLVMSDTARKRISDDDLELLSTLEHRGVIEVRRIRSDEYTGGLYRTQQTGASDAMLAIGGGKGTYVTGNDMIAAGKPVLPLDLDIGALSEDGGGALHLHGELMQHASRFFPCTHNALSDRLDTLTLRVHSPSIVAQRAAEFLSRELEACGASLQPKRVSFEPIRRLARRLTWSEWVKLGERLLDMFRLL